MKIKLNRDELLRPLAIVSGVVERRQTLPILAFVLIRQEAGQITITGTDLEIEVVANVEGSADQAGAVTVPARKLLDICRALPDGTEVHLEQQGERVRVRGGKSRFSLVSLPSNDFPALEIQEPQFRLQMEQADLLRLLQQTQFCMAQQDIRYYLNGLLLELNGTQLRAVATDGHRMAVSNCTVSSSHKEIHQIIVPRKAVHEISRLLSNEDTVDLQFHTNHLRLELTGVRFSTKLIDGRFPDYTKVIPANQSKNIRLPRDSFKEALSRVAILSNEKYRGVRFALTDSLLTISAHNPEQEEAIEEVAVKYSDEPVEIGFNVSYIADATAAVEGEEITLGLSDASSSCTITAPDNTAQQYVVMPMRL